MKVLVPLMYCFKLRNENPVRTRDDPNKKETEPWIDKSRNFLAVLDGNLNAEILSSNLLRTRTTPSLIAGINPLFFSPLYLAVGKKRRTNRNDAQRLERSLKLPELLPRYQLIGRCRVAQLFLMLFNSVQKGHERLEDTRNIALHDSVFVFRQRCTDHLRQC
jgi:hypothetical protein